MGQGSGFHGPLGVRVESGPVADGQPAEQCGTGFRQVGGDGDEGGPGDCGAAEQAVRRCGRTEVTTDEEDERGRRSGLVGLELTAHLDDRPGRDCLPTRFERGHDPDRDA
ncbi:hypothetical protein [Curtobacterium sp. MCBD17_023]|uniref:hypothetical protein n=1 Tax=Curtobacterium sp. MCBD17_023 TaxID=2175657 RepID=UPI0021AD3D6D|nr:hypothetical protein [Curtobacterium sp. MCBD17_023]